MSTVLDMGVQIKRAAFSIVLVVMACWLVYSGTQFVRFDYFHRDFTAELAAARTGERSEDDMLAVRERLTAWQNTPGVSYLARTDYRDAGTIIVQPPITSMQEAAAVLKVDPVNGQAWVDLAKAARREPNSRPLALAAWQMSAIAAPREYPIMLGRIAFLMGIWRTAGPEQKREFFFETDLLRAEWGAPFRADWRRMLAYLPDEQKEALEDEMRAHNPDYKR